MTTVQPGSQLGPFQILAAIGSGGMGEVWKAHDTRLNRIVAIKVVHARFSERFEREARAVAALNHPNICQLYDVGPNYLVMELVEGQTLEERIREGAIPLAEAARLATQIAEALAAAHEKDHPQGSEARERQDQARRQREGSRLWPSEGRRNSGGWIERTFSHSQHDGGD